MALQGSIVITAKVDSGDASKQLQELIGRIEALEGNQKKAASAAQEHEDKLESLKRASQAAASTLAVVAAGIVAAGVASIKLAADLEQSKVAFTTLLGSAEKADGFLRDLAKFAAQTPFEFKGLQDSARRLLAFGFAAQDIIPLMNGIGNAVAGLGGGKEQIDRVTLALGQMQAKGKVSAEEMNQLAELGIPAWKFIASAIGVSIPEAMKRAEKGAIDSTTAINALINGMNKKFPGMMEKQSKTINGVFSNLVDGATRTATLIGERLIRAFHVTDIIGNAANIIAGFAATIEKAGLVAAIDRLFPPGLQIAIIGVAGALTASLIPAITTAYTAFATLAGPAIASVSPFLLAGASIAALAYTIARNWEGLTGFFSGLFSGISTLVGKLVENIRKPFAAVIDWIREKLRSLLEIVSGVLERIGAFVPAPIKQALGNALTFLQAKAEDVKDAIGGAVQGVITLGGKATTALGSGIKALSDFITPDVQALIDMAKAGAVSTAFTGLHGAAPAAAAAAGAQNKAKKSELYGPFSPEEERKKAQEHAKKILEVALKQAEVQENGDTARIQALYQYWQRLQEIGASSEDIELARIAIIEAGNKSADDAQKKYIEKQKQIAEEEQKRISQTADYLRQAYSMASELLAGDFSAVASTIGKNLQDQIVGALSKSPAVQSAISSFASFLTGPAGLAVGFGSLLVMGIMSASEQARIAAKQAKEDAISVDKLLHPEKYQQPSQRAQDLLDKANDLQKKLNDLIATFNMRASAESGLFGPITAGLNKALGGGSAADVKKQIDETQGLIDQVMAEWEKEAGRAAIQKAMPGMVERSGFDPASVFKGLAETVSQALNGKQGGAAVMPGETPDRPIYTQVVNVRDFREAFPDSAYFRAPSVDTTRSLNANAVAYR